MRVGKSSGAGHLTLHFFIMDNEQSITVFVRNKAKLLSQLNDEAPALLNIIEGDIQNSQQVGEAIKGHDTLINTAGNAADGDAFHQLTKIIIKQAEIHFTGKRRVWILAGMAILNFPKSSIMGTDLPVMNKMYANHKANYEF